MSSRPGKKYLLLVSIPGIPIRSYARNSMSGDTVVLWNDEIVNTLVDVSVGSIRRTYTLHGLHALTYEGRIDEALNGHNARIERILTEEESKPFLTSHRPFPESLPKGGAK